LNELYEGRSDVQRDRLYLFGKKHPDSDTRRFATLPGVLALYDFFYGLKVVFIIDSPPAPIPFYSAKQTLALPAKERCARNIITVANLIGFILLRGFADGHGTLSGQLTSTEHSKYSY